ncbi:MAG: hypothetical protein QXG39_04825 [Candidatus Aenigmatarchaeota archaeon]
MVKISKKEWEEFQEWIKSKNQKANQKANEEPEPLELEIEDYEDLAVEEEQEIYICGNCGYESETIFEICPKCKAKNKFD